jgi:hypothetical protein
LTLTAQPAAQRGEGTGAATARLRIAVLSGRADMVTGGDALVHISGAASVRAGQVTLNGRDIAEDCRWERARSRRPLTAHAHRWS